eukprot:9115144-Alexandrium_andersonii.AAC.1
MGQGEPSFSQAAPDHQQQTTKDAFSQPGGRSRQRRALFDRMITLDSADKHRRTPNSACKGLRQSARGPFRCFSAVSSAFRRFSSVLVLPKSARSGLEQFPGWLRGRFGWFSAASSTCRRVSACVCSAEERLKLNGVML